MTNETERGSSTRNTIEMYYAIENALGLEKAGQQNEHSDLITLLEEAQKTILVANDMLVDMREHLRDTVRLMGNMIPCQVCKMLGAGDEKHCDTCRRNAWHGLELDWEKLGEELDENEQGRADEDRGGSGEGEK